MTRAPRGLSAREFIRALQADGFVLQRVRGSHRIFRHADGRRVVLAYHGLTDTFPIGTLRAMITDAGWQDERFTASGFARLTRGLGPVSLGEHQAKIMFAFCSP